MEQKGANEKKDGIQKIVDKLKDIPTLPSVVAKIIEIVDSPTTSANDLNKAISLDQALSAKVLKLVNSAFYGFPKRIETLRQAVVILGFNTVRSLALSISMVDFFSPKSGKHRLNYVEFWKHSIGTAILSRALAKKSVPNIAEEAFVSGLLHDIGILILDQYLPDDFHLAVEIMQNEKLGIHEAEKKTLGLNHSDVGRMVAVKWNLPDPLLYSISYHHNPLPSRDYFPITAVVHAADIGIKMLNQGGVGDNGFIRGYHIAEDARRLLKLHVDYPKDMLEVVQQGISEAEEMLQLLSQPQ